MRRKFIGQWVTLQFNSSPQRAKIEDIEFTDRGPLFHLVTAYGNTFRLSREELRDHEEVVR